MVTEQLGSFYLGGSKDKDASDARTPVLYDARDLTTHAVCVGMTGSGKTGLCIDLLEEAALDKVPALVIDPKGDITNLLLQFPQLRPEDFQPWINTDDARRKGQSVEEYAAKTSEQWKNGLADWGMDGSRIEALKESADFTIYTPGSDAGVPVNIMGSMAAPEGDFDNDAEMLRERIAGTVAALLGLVGVKADPVRGREGILLATIFEYYWRQGKDLDLAALILAIQTPPMEKLGVFDLETFFPTKDRLELAMSFNSLLASPSFGEWLSGDPLDIASLLYQADGTPRHSVFYLAHLSDSERMFFVTLLLESVITWMRRQSGTTSLRALLYFDEVFGFFPPTAEPPSKRPLLTIMKQARAFGLGAVLVTQNPVDIDYKGLANAGTWFIGKMQTERDRARVLAGLQGAIADAGGATGNTDFDGLISGLESRMFLLHNVHADAPQVFYTRWAMSYLRGPMTRPQVRTLMEQAGKRASSAPVQATTVAAVAEETPPEPRPPAQANDAAPDGYNAEQPILDSSVSQLYLPLALSSKAAADQASIRAGAPASAAQPALTYLPGAICRATVQFVDRTRELNVARDYELWYEFGSDEAIAWDQALKFDARDIGLSSAPENANSARDERGPFFAPLPQWFDTLREMKSSEKDLSDWLYYGARYSLSYQQGLDVVQRPDESERDFAVRVRQAAREARDAEVDALEDKYDDQMAKVQERIDTAQKRIADLEANLSSNRQTELIGLGENALNFFLSRRSSKAFSGISSRRSKTVKAHSALESEREKMTDLESDITDLKGELEEATSEITVKWADALDAITALELKPRRTDVTVEPLALGWAPYWLFEYEDGGYTRRVQIPAYEIPEDKPAA